MSEGLRYQIRIHLSDPFARIAQAGQAGQADPGLVPLVAVLSDHRAAMVSQLDAFEAYVRTAEQAGPEGFPLYHWTKATIDDPAKRAKHGQVFAVRIDGEELYSRDAADALETALRPLVGAGLIARLSRHDTDPASAMPVPAEYRS